MILLLINIIKEEGKIQKISKLILILIISPLVIKLILTTYNDIELIIRRLFSRSNFSSNVSPFNKIHLLIFMIILIILSIVFVVKIIRFNKIMKPNIKIWPIVLIGILIILSTTFFYFNEYYSIINRIFPSLLAK
jgi:uncharacterized membrane protein YidH (DUF202 family)